MKQTNQEKLTKAVELLREVRDNWDNDKVENYPEELPSFDELVFSLWGIELNN